MDGESSPGDSHAKPRSESRTSLDKWDEQALQREETVSHEKELRST
jgi:hypothetical protein